MCAINSSRPDGRCQTRSASLANPLIEVRWISAFALALLTCVVSNGAEPTSPTAMARKLLNAKRESITPNQLVGVLNALPIQPGQSDWAEGAFLAAELILKMDPQRSFQKADQLFARLEQQSSPPWQARGKIGRIRVKGGTGGDWATLAKELDALVKSLTESNDESAVDAAYYLGATYRQLKRHDGARDAFQHALKMHAFLKQYQPGNAYHGLIGVDKINAAIKSLRGPEGKPKDAESEVEKTFAEARKAQLAKRYTRAFALYFSLLVHWPEHELAEQARFRIGECRLQDGDATGAARYFEQFVAASPNGPWRGHAHLLLGNIALLHSFDPDAAFAHYVTILDPSVQPQSRRKRGPSLRLSKEQLERVPLKADLGEKTWQEVHADAHRQIGILAFFLGLHELAASHLERSSELRPDLSFRSPGGVACLAELAKGKEEPLPRTYLRQGDRRSQFVLFYASALVQAWDTEASLPLFERVYRNEFGHATPEQRAYARFGMGDSYFIRGIETRPEAIKIYGEFLTPPLSGVQIAPRAVLALAVAHSVNADSKKCIE